MSSSHAFSRSAAQTPLPDGPQRRPARHRPLPPAVRAVVLLALPLTLFVVALTLPGTAHANNLGGGNTTLSVSPESGPVGAHLTATGTHFKAGAPVQIGYSSASDCSNMTAITGASGTAGSDGSLSIPVIWPQTNAGSYTICARDTNANKTYPSTSPFQVLIASPATITVSSPVVSSKTVTVTGANFLPGGEAVEVFYGVPAAAGASRTDVCANSAGTKTADSKGNFTLTFTAPFYAADTKIVITAVSPQATCGGSPVLMAQKNVMVLAVAPTATAATNNTAPSSPISLVWPPTGIWSVVYCLIGLLLFLLLLLALLVASRNRSQGQSASNGQRTQQGNQQAQAGGRLMGSTQVAVGADGRPVATEQIYAQGRRGAPVHVANVEDTVEEEPMPDLSPSSGTNPPTPRYGPR